MANSCIVSGSRYTSHSAKVEAREAGNPIVYPIALPCIERASVASYNNNLVESPSKSAVRTENVPSLPNSSKNMATAVYNIRKANRHDNSRTAADRCSYPTAAYPKVLVPVANYNRSRVYTADDRRGRCAGARWNDNSTLWIDVENM